MVLCCGIQALFFGILLDDSAHLINLPVHVDEILIEDMFLGLLGREGVELRKVNVMLFLFLDGLHVKVGLAVELRGLELLTLLDVHAVPVPGLGLDEIPCGLTAYPSCRHVRYLAGRNEAVHVLIQIDGGLVTVDGDTFLQLHHLSEDVVECSPE